MPLNDKSSTYLHPATGSYSSLDLTLCSPEVAPDFIWKVDEDLHGSNHFPILVLEVGPSIQQRPERWTLHKANREQFKVYSEQSIDQNAFNNCENPAELLFTLQQRNRFLEPRHVKGTQASHGLRMIVRKQ